MLLGALEDVETDLIVSRTELDAATAELQGKVLAFGREYFDELSGGGHDAPAGWQSEWNSFAARFKVWAPSWYLFGLTRRKEYLAFARQFADLVTRYRATGGTTSITPKVIPVDAGKGPLDKASDAASSFLGGVGTAAKTVLYIGAGALALRLLLPILLSARRPAASKNPRRRRRLRHQGRSAYSRR